MCPKRLYTVCLETVVPVAEESYETESLPKPGDDTLGDSKFLGYFQLGKSTFQSSNNSTTNLECVSILLSSIWDSDFHGFGNLGLKEGRDFRGGGPMAVQEALAMERSLIGGWHCRLPVRDSAGPSVVDNEKTSQKTKTKGKE
ncbi:hypothetical protein TNCV_4891351 [Trichonephila clavipes]|nr:hypothetical protein TNCV_4891351 [Trichonephila clavipes]